jgi:hypothetical protein
MGTKIKFTSQVFMGQNELMYKALDIEAGTW